MCQPVAEVAAATAAPLFVDACASAGRLPLPAGWAAAAASAHKWGGPAGVGVLLVRKGARWRNPFPGDDRVDERATGFENVPAALAAAAALRASRRRAGRGSPSSTRALTAMLARRGSRDPGHRGVPGTRASGSRTWSPSPASTSTARRWSPSWTASGFAVASGSACTASTLEPSHVLAAMGALTHGNVRVSLGRDTDPADVAAPGRGAARRRRAAAHARPGCPT